MIPDRDDGHFWGEPEEKELLFGYKDSWAHVIYKTYDHEDAVCIFRHQSMPSWDLENECQGVKDVVEASGLLPAVLSYVDYDVVTVNCFSERFYGETDTMHFPCGEMTIIPDDAKQILVLDVHGKAVLEGNYTKELSWEQLHMLTMKLFGWDEETSKSKFHVNGGYTTKSFRILMLRKEFGETKNKVNLTTEEIHQTAAAYLLYILGTRIFPDTSGSRVNANFLQLLDPFNEVCKYSWGTAMIAHLLGEMRKANKALTNQFVGNFTLLQVWAYEHFPTLFVDNQLLKINVNWQPEQPRALKYVWEKGPISGNKSRIVKMRLALDQMMIDKVVFDPYKLERDLLQCPVIPDNVSFYNGPLFHTSGYVMYNPWRVMRQLGFKQQIVNEGMFKAFEHDYELSKSTPKRLVTVYIPTPILVHWRDRERLCMVNHSTWTLVGNGDEVDPGYYQDYRSYSHPIVIRPESVEVPPRPTMETPPTTFTPPPTNFTPPPTPKSPDSLRHIFLYVRKRFGGLRKWLSCKAEKGEVLTLEEIRLLTMKLQNVENPEAKELFDENKKKRVVKRMRRE
ncbi:protein MAINTENANCE OF MERISTEMS-like [Papaver somniferum]|nr:protein MAINTENANCE OF MERISTEMS-like [Papaver somniferum]